MQGRSEVGFFARFHLEGKMEFNSLTGLLPATYKSFGEVWKIHKTPIGIVFQSFTYIFTFYNKKIIVTKPVSTFTNSFFAKGQTPGG